tara:strand:- start:656930 stop:657667 length:738 start_codon:yes stop_codon:yes gene_type:complete
LKHKAFNPAVEVVSSTSEAGEFVANLITQAAIKAVAERGRFTLAIPGGGSPRAVFEVLSKPANLQIFPWSKTQLLWVDERAVPPEHPDSNAGVFIREVFTDLPLIPANIHRMLGELGPEHGAAAYRETLQTVLNPDGGHENTIDFALLGIGEDGHIASLFPGDAALDSTDTIIPIFNSPKPPPERITMTMPVIKSAKEIVVLVLGQGKADAVAKSLAGEPLPAHLVTDGTNTTWVIDQAAASDLP